RPGKHPLGRPADDPVFALGAAGVTRGGDRRRSEVLVYSLRRHPRSWRQADHVKAGHSLIKAKMREERAELAGEMSGHIFFKNRYFGFDDAIYSSARLLEILSHERAKLSELLKDVPKTFASPELRVATVDGKEFKIVL